LYYANGSGSKSDQHARRNPGPVFLGAERIRTISNGPNGLNTNLWTAPYDYAYEAFYIDAEASDSSGEVGTSPSIQITVIPPSNGSNTMARIDSLPGAEGPLGSYQLSAIPTVTNGFLTALGAATNSAGSSVIWTLGIYDLNWNLIRDVTPLHNASGQNTNAVGTATSSGLLVSNCDLTTLLNGSITCS